MYIIYFISFNLIYIFKFTKRRNILWHFFFIFDTLLLILIKNLLVLFIHILDTSSYLILLKYLLLLIFHFKLLVTFFIGTSIIKI
jgi:hypothetical protein